MKRRFFRPLLFPIGDASGYKAMWEDFLLGLSSGDPNRCLVNGELGRRDLAFIEAAYTSVKHPVF